MTLVTDPKDPRLSRGTDDAPVPQAAAYLVLSEEERAKGFVRPVRRTYIHVGRPGPRFPLVDLDDEQRERYGDAYAAYEPYPESERPSLGKYWSQQDLDSVGQGCGASTTMSLAIAETYARNPSFYGATYCARCRKHLRVGPDGEFVWEDGSRVGT